MYTGRDHGIEFKGLSIRTQWSLFLLASIPSMTTPTQAMFCSLDDDNDDNDDDDDDDESKTQNLASGKYFLLESQNAAEPWRGAIHKRSRKLNLFFNKS